MKNDTIEAFAVMVSHPDGRVVIYHVAEIKDLEVFVIEDFQLGAVSVSIFKEILSKTTQTSPRECR